MRKYGYTYDGLNRLRSAIYQKPGSTVNITSSYNESLRYDKNGNISYLERTGEYDDEVYTMTIDRLSYTYSNDKPNMLSKVFDDTNNPKGFKDDSQGLEDLDDDYGYDEFGNMKSDTNKGISDITYNHLNLPVKIVMNNGEISYIYDASGRKVRKKVSEYVGGPEGYVYKDVEYAGGGFQYRDEVLAFYPHAEGYVNVLGVKGNQGNEYHYVYNYTDHLGNVRLSYGFDPSTGTVKILEEDNYYPFGLKHANYNVDEKTYMKEGLGETIISTSNGCPIEYKYKYNGKELQDELGLNMYSYNARNYMPDIGRWGVIDPFTVLSPNKNPYHFASNNPINRIDPTGLTDYRVNGETRTIDDGHDGVSMNVSQRQFDRLQKKFDAGGSGYERLMNRLSNKNGFTTTSVSTTQDFITGAMTASITTEKHAAGSGTFGQWAIGENHQTYGVVEHVARVADSGLGSLTGQFGNINLGSNGSMYLRNNNGAIFRGNQYVSVTSAASKYSGLVKGAKWGGLATGVALGGYEIYQGVQQDGGTYGYNAQVQTAGAVGGLVGGYAGAELGAATGAAVGVWFGGVGAVPGAIIGGLIGGAVGGWSGDYYGEQAAKAVIK